MAKKALKTSAADVSTTSNVIDINSGASVLDLSSKMMLAGLSISLWTNRKEEKRVTDDASAVFSADAGRLRATKDLIDAKALQGVQQAATRVRDIHKKLTAPWLDDGRRILSVLNFSRYSDDMRAAREEFNAEVEDFLGKYPGLADASRQSLSGLGQLFDEGDYPTVDNLRKKFGVQTSVSPMPAGRDFRVGLSDQEAKRIAAEIDERLKTGVDAAMRSTWDNVAKAVSHMSAKLKEFEPGKEGQRAKGIFRDSLVNNLAELVDLLPGLNLTGDPELARAAELIRAELVDGMTADDLREDETLRQNTAAAADKIMAEFAGFMSPATE